MPPTSRNPLKVGLFGLRLLLAIFFMTVGSMKLLGVPRMIETFHAIGAGQWLRHVTGLLEISGGAALVVLFLAPFAAVLLAMTMVVAALAHLLILPGSPILALVLFVLCGLIAWVERNQIINHLDRYFRQAPAAKNENRNQDR